MNFQASNKVFQYEEFLNETLKSDLRKLNDQREKCFEDISQYYQLKTLIENIKKSSENKPLQTQVDLGCNFYAEGVVQDPSKIFICVGFGFYVEFTHSEALRFVSKKVTLLEKQAKDISKSMASVKAHIRMVVEALRELQLVS